MAFEPARLPSKERVWSWVKTINEFGPRLTGSDAQARCVDFIAAEFEKIGLAVMRDTRHLQRWEPERWALTIMGASRHDVPIASPFPYSGRTPPAGLSGELVWYDYPPISFRRAAGKIAVVKVCAKRLTPAVVRLVTKRKAALPADADITSAERTPLIGGLASGVNLRRAADAGVLGVICVWHGCAEDDIKDQYLPFTTPYGNCPSLWVGAAEGDRLRAACRRGDHANLVLEARLDDDVKTDTIYAVLPGTDAAETVLVNTHSDGPNAVEENGSAGVLALAHYFASLPQAARRRTIIFVAVTGHFQLPQLGHGGQATKAWLDRHPELWDGKPGHRHAVAGLTLEHLGCLEWKEDEDGNRYGPTGRLERELVYVTNATMQDVYRTAAEDRTKIRSLIIGPRNGFFFGEAEPLYKVNIPSISLCPLPNYLCTMPQGGGIEKIDPDFLYEQIGTFAKSLSMIDAIAAALIGPIDRDISAFVRGITEKLFGI